MRPNMSIRPPMVIYPELPPLEMRLIRTMLAPRIRGRVMMPVLRRPALISLVRKVLKTVFVIVRRVADVVALRQVVLPVSGARPPPRAV